MPASRRYRLDTEDEDCLGVRMADGTLFISLTRAPSQVVSHLCGADTYRGRLLFPRADMWLEEWRVHGPRKTYHSLARYDRAAAP